MRKIGVRISNLYIAQVKGECRIIERRIIICQSLKAARQPKCPPEKERTIRKALEYYHMF